MQVRKFTIPQEAVPTVMLLLAVAASRRPRAFPWMDFFQLFIDNVLPILLDCFSTSEDWVAACQDPSIIQIKLIQHYTRVALRKNGKGRPFERHAMSMAIVDDVLWAANHADEDVLTKAYVESSEAIANAKAA